MTWNVNKAPTNPAYFQDPAYFQQPMDMHSTSTAFDVVLPPISIFAESRSYEARQLTGFAPRHLPPSTLSIVYFSEANLQWIQKMILADVLKSSGIHIASPDSTNMKVIMTDVWYQSYENRLFSEQKTVLENLAYIDAIVRSKANENIRQGMQATLDYEMKVAQGPQYQNLPSPISEGNKISTTSGTLDTGSVLFGTNTNTTASSVITLNQATSPNETGWNELAAQSAAWNNANSFRSRLDIIPM